MQPYAEMSTEELQELRKQLSAQYKEFQGKDLRLDMSRGKPSVEQLDLSMGMMDVLSSSDDLTCEDGTDCRNYGGLTGIREAKELIGDMMEVAPDYIIIYGNSSLNVMFDTVSRSMTHGVMGCTPWCKLDKVKFLCPVPGYDRHFAITQYFGIEMINVPMTPDGPDMDMVERLVAEDDSIKGIWCVPKYSNPGGVTYSDEVVRELASMPTAADDFRIFWDNAYTVHHLYDDVADQDQLLDIADACVEAGNPNRYFKFGSTSKVTLPGAGISAMAASPENIADIKARMGVQTIGHDKINQLRHVKFLKDADGIAEHMAKHAAIIRPKFELVLETLSNGFEGTGCGSWSNPRGGYFISFDAPEGTAKRIVSLAKDAGVTMTGAGATYPYKNDPEDSNIRIAPTLPPLEELDQAMKVFVTCVKLAAVEKLLED